MSVKKRILVAPLDWGLGHAARCVPVIELLLQKQVEPVIAADGAAALMLKERFPRLQHIRLQGYEPRYPSSGHMALSMTWQSPRFFRRIHHEHELLKELVSAYRIDGVIADNRYGLWHQQVPSVLMTHQLFIQGGARHRWLEPLLARIVSGYAGRFTLCWVPDMPGADNLSGKLSHGARVDENIRYIGPLSRLKPMNNEQRYAVAALISGPEPQRNLFEQQVTRELADLGKPGLIIAGTPGETEPTQVNERLTRIPFLDSEALAQTLSAAGMVICRSGYSTIMDLVALGRTALLVPTPGQTEQEYLAQRLHDKGWFQWQQQNALMLTEALMQNDQYRPPVMEVNGPLLHTAVDELLELV